MSDCDAHKPSSERASQRPHRGFGAGSEGFDGGSGRAQGLDGFLGRVAALRARLRAIEDELTEEQEAECDGEDDAEEGQAENGAKGAAKPDPNLSPEGNVIEPPRSALSLPPLDAGVLVPAIKGHEARQPQSTNEDHALVSFQESIRLKIPTTILNVFDDVLEDLFLKDEAVPARLNNLPAISKLDERD